MTDKAQMELKPRPGESAKAHAKRIADFISGADVRTKTDLVDWTGSPPFHLDVPEQAKP